MAVESIEYVNSENMAVTVLEAPFTEFDAELGTLIPNATVARRVVYFMSTVTLGLQATPWARDYQREGGAERPQGTLCPALRRLPNVGSMTTELVAAGVNAMRPVVNLAVALPGLVRLWRQGRACPAVTHGHSLLRRCGDGVFSLDDAFESLERANAHFWAGLGIVASRARDLGQEDVANVADGVAYFGQGTGLAVGGQARYLIQSMQLPFSKVTVGVLSSVMPPGAGVFSAASFVTASPLRVARFSYAMVSGAVADAIPLAIRLERDARDRPAARQLLRVFSDRFYAGKDGYYRSVTSSLLQACAGASLTLGYTNAWAALLRKQCEASALAMQGAYDALSSILVDVPFAKCLCVDAAAAGANFESYAMENCYYFAPAHLRPTLLGMIQRAVLGTDGGQQGMCEALVGRAGEAMAGSMRPFFVKQLQVRAFPPSPSPPSHARLKPGRKQRAGQRADLLQRRLPHRARRPRRGEVHGLPGQPLRHGPDPRARGLLLRVRHDDHVRRKVRPRL